MLEFLSLGDVRPKIKKDFLLDRMFEDNKQTKAFKKIADSHHVIMKEKENTAVRSSQLEE